MKKYILILLLFFVSCRYSKYNKHYNMSAHRYIKKENKKKSENENKRWRTEYKLKKLQHDTSTNAKDGI